MTQRHDTTNEIEDDKVAVNSGIKAAVITIVIALVLGMGGYIFQRGLNTNENVATLKMEVAVIRADHDNLKDNVAEIKAVVIEIRKDQIRRYKQEK